MNNNNALSSQPPAFLTRGEGLDRGQSLPPTDPPLDTLDRVIDTGKAFIGGVAGGASALANLPVRGGKYLSNKVFDTDFDTSTGWLPATEDYIQALGIKDAEALPVKFAETIGEFAGAELATLGAAGGLAVLAKGANLNRTARVLNAVASRPVGRVAIDSLVAGSTQTSLDEFTDLPDAAKIPILFGVTFGTGAILNKAGGIYGASRMRKTGRAFYDAFNETGAATERLPSVATATAKKTVSDLENILQPIRVDASPAARRLNNSFNNVLDEIRPNTTSKYFQPKARVETIIQAKRSINEALNNPELSPNLKRVGVQAINQFEETILAPSMPKKAYDLLKGGDNFTSIAHTVENHNSKVLKAIGKSGHVDSYASKGIAYYLGGKKGLAAFTGINLAKDVAYANDFGRNFSRIYANNPEFREALFNLYSHAVRGASSATITRLIKEADKAAGQEKVPDGLSDAPPSFLRQRLERLDEEEENR